ncbi:uncharacterized protein LOC135386686 [Ornithodoros turicata]|uniref:uncharacterized protein LOC135386686 n=1 Tax=Ornithodoros turicata TaxID=34597 RepID=UPI003139D5A5
MAWNLYTASTLRSPYCIVDSNKRKTLIKDMTQCGGMIVNVGLWNQICLYVYIDTPYRHLRRYVRVSPEQFDYLLSLIRHRLQKHPHGRPALEPAHRLAVTLRYLASGSHLSSVAYSFRIGFTTFKRIVYETCAALWEELMPVYLPNPTPEVWAQFAHNFEERWAFPNCVGAVDGKHIVIEAPKHGGSVFYNYKGSHSIVLMAVADASYRFLFVDIGAYGSQSDGGIFKTCTLLEAGGLGLPPPRRHPGSSLEAPMCTDLGDTKGVYNTRPSHARYLIDMHICSTLSMSGYEKRCVENAFGIRWRIFRRPLNLKVENVELLVQASIVLHNFLKAQEEAAPGGETYCPPGVAASTTVIIRKK